MFKKSKYYIAFFDKKSNNYLLYNFFTQSLLSASPSIYNKLKVVFKNPDDFQDTSEFRILYKEGFILSSDIDETKKLQLYVQKEIPSAPLRITIATTLSCNFSCVYCFQNKSESFLTHNQANAILNYINSKKGRQLDLMWIGGEPLLNTEIIKYISENIQIPFSSTLYTNGYLLDKVINDLPTLNIKGIYLTIDGLPLKHNSLRYTSTDNNTFDKIFSNIQKIIEHYPEIKIVVKSNLENISAYEIDKFFDVFKPLQGKIRITLGNIIQKENIQNKMTTINNNQNQIDYNNIYYDKLLSNSFAIYKLPSISVVGCDAYLNDSLAFSPVGNVHKCIEGIGTKNLIIGQIKNDVIQFDKPQLAFIKAHNIFSNVKCTNCSIFPHCMGGCLMGQLFEKTDNKKAICFKLNYNSLTKMISNWYNVNHNIN